MKQPENNKTIGIPGNEHVNHRDRMRQRLLDHKESTFFDHELLEMLLYSCVPRVDTNPLSHRLLARFGSLHEVLRANVEDLCTVEGVGQNTALQIHLVHVMLLRYQMSLFTHAKRRPAISKPGDMGNFFTAKLAHYQEEAICIACLDGQNRIKSSKVLCLGSTNSIQVQPYQIAQFAMENHSGIVALAHNHPEGLCNPSPEDIRTTVALRDQLQGIGIRLVEHVIVGDGSYLLMSDFDIFRQ